MDCPYIPTLDFLFMRHAQSVDNRAMTIPCGNGCKGLTELGRQQVRDAAKALQAGDFHPHVIFSSPLPRAQSTAILLADMLSLPIKYLPELREQDLGSWEGQTWARVEKQFSEGIDPPGGETYADFYRRIRAALNEIDQIRPESAIVVSHGGVWRAVQTLCGQREAEWLPNAAICHVAIAAGQLESRRFFEPLS